MGARAHRRCRRALARRSRSARALVREAGRGGLQRYALSPVDLIPDVIPVLGYLDDLLIVPLGIMQAVRLVPEPVMRELRAKARRRERPASRLGLAFVVLGWTAAYGLILWLLWPG